MDIERKLASVRRIASIDPIEGADKIVCVTVDGWKLVSAKDNDFQVGDLVVYFEIDSFLPVREEFEWLRKSSFKTVPGLGEGFRIKTIKLRGQVSQGLIVPLSDFFTQDENGKWYTNDGLIVITEGEDLTSYLNVKKYEKPIPMNMQGRTKGNFPSFIRKTDQERVQNCWGGIKKWMLNDTAQITEIIDEDDINNLEAGIDIVPGGTFFKSGDRWFEKNYLPNPPEVRKERGAFEATLKLDGSSLTVYHFNGQLGVCSRNLELTRDPENPFWKATLASGILHYLLDTGDNLALQFELMGPGVQDNRENLPDYHIFLFDIFDINKQEYFVPKDRIAWMQDAFESKFVNKSAISHVPVLVNIELDGSETVDYFLGVADEQKSLTHPIAEGIVFKSHVPNGPSFKVISNKFLLKEKD